jgi:light-regulated signal transduction histidine kinase (bacteriophytochrome)
MAHNSSLAIDASLAARASTTQRAHPPIRQAQLCREELDVVCHALSHDLRAPLRSIESFSQLLRASLCEKLDEQTAANFQRVIKASNQMGCLLDGLLQLTRVTRHVMRKTVVDLSEMAQHAVARSRSLHPETTIDVSVMTGLSAVGDRLLLQLALEHLFENAWKFSRPGNSEISFGGNYSDTDPIFYLYDNGIGFDMAYYEQLFGVFERLHTLPDSPGCGIGLAIVKRILQRHKGSIWAKGIPGLGACFWFNIPKNGTHETTTLHPHDRGQRKRRDARKAGAGAAVNQL